MLTTVAKAGVDFLALEGPPPTVTAMKVLAESVPSVLPDTSEVRAALCCEAMLHMIYSDESC